MDPCSSSIHDSEDVEQPKCKEINLFIIQSGGEKIFLHSFEAVHFSSIVFIPKILATIEKRQERESCDARRVFKCSTSNKAKWKQLIIQFIN
jgi:hypothetical protein